MSNENVTDDRQTKPIHIEVKYWKELKPTAAALWYELIYKKIISTNHPIVEEGGKIYIIL